MIIFTDEIFLNVKHIYTVNVGTQYVGDNSYTWFVRITGFLALAPSGFEHFDQTITCSSEEHARKFYKEVMKQIVDSGDVAELNNKSFDEVLSKGEVK